MLNVLRGLSPRLSQAVSIIALQAPFPSFVCVRSMLLLDEMSMNNTKKVTAAIALVYTASSGTGHVSSSRGDASCHAEHSDQGRSSNNYNKNKGHCDKNIDGSDHNFSNNRGPPPPTSATLPGLPRTVVVRRLASHCWPRSSRPASTIRPTPGINHIVRAILHVVFSGNTLVGSVRPRLHHE